MCGIAGLFDLHGRPIAAETPRRMIAPLNHRGPDAQGIYTSGPVGLAHARLSIIDLSGGAQPMLADDDTLALTFNGEIFNYVELRAELIARGRRFASHSDTETILHAYAEYGTDCVRHFNGQWSFALWDERRRRLFVSRDRLGVRPLFYTVVDGGLRFASEVKALFTDPAVPRAIDIAGLDQLFTFWGTLPPRTIFAGVHELPPGHNLIVEDGRLRVERYWQLDYDLSGPRLSEQEYAEQLLALLTDATRLRLRSDVPVGAYLSGGLDSAVTTALVKQCTNKHLRTFSVTFDDAEYDESGYQQQVVRALETDHQSIRCTYADIGRVFPDVVWHAERPLLRTAPAPLFMLSQLVRDEGYKVVLTGEGADEVLGGYDIFKEAKVRRFWARQPGSPSRSALFGQLYPYMPNLQAQSPAYREAFFHARPEDLANPLFSHLPRWELTSRLKRFFARDVQATLLGSDAYADCLAALPSSYGAWRPFCQAQYLETTMLLPGYILSAQGDRVAMAHSVEGRFPFLDVRVAEFAARIPPRLKMKGLREKHILKRAAGHLIPSAVAERPKQPYRAPDAKSFFGDAGSPVELDYVDELLSPERVARAGLFDPRAVASLVQKARRGQVIGAKDNMALVGILSAQLVVDQFIDGHRPQRGATSESGSPALLAGNAG